MKLRHTIVPILLTLSLIILQFSLCSPPIKPDFPPQLRNDRTIRTEGTPKAGEKFIMYIEAVSNNPLTYRWYKDRVILKDAEHDSFVIDSLTSEDEGMYKCEVFALSASVVSKPYELQIERDTKGTLLENNSMIFSSGKPQLDKRFFLYVKPAGDLPLTFQWYKNFEIIKGATKDTLLLWPVSNTDRGNFYCKVKHKNREEVSMHYLLEIGNNPPVWDNATMSSKINAGDILKLSLKDSCNDGDNDRLTFTLMDGKPDNDLISNGIYEFQSNPGDNSEYHVSIIASDGNISSIGVINITVIHDSKGKNNHDSIPDVNHELTEKDTQGPEITLKKPERDSATVDTSSVTVTITCTDKSGVNSVTLSFNEQLLEATKVGDDRYTVNVTGLSYGENILTFIAVDESSNKNISKKSVRITYDYPVTIDSVTSPIDGYSLAYFHFDEDSGDTLLDECGNFFGILKGATRTTGFKNNGILCTEGKYAIFDTIIPEGTKNGTVEFYFKLKESFDPSMIYTFFGNRGSRVHVIYNKGTLYFQKNHHNIHKYVGDTTTLIPDTWYKCAVTWGSKGMRLFLDDELIASNNDTSDYRIDNLIGPVTTSKYSGSNVFFAGYKEWGGMEGIGISDRSTTYYFNGILDEIHISSIERY